MLRAFKDVDEFVRTTGFSVGDVIITHVVQNWVKSPNFALKERLITGFDHYTNKVYFGLDWYPLDELLGTYEYLKGDKWLPFGVDDPNLKKNPVKFQVGKKYYFFDDYDERYVGDITVRYKDPFDEKLKVVFNNEVCEIHTDKDGNERLYVDLIDNEVKAEDEVKE